MIEHLCINGGRKASDMYTLIFQIRHQSHQRMQAILLHVCVSKSKTSHPGQYRNQVLFKQDSMKFFYIFFCMFVFLYFWFSWQRWFNRWAWKYKNICGVLPVNENWWTNNRAQYFKSLLWVGCDVRKGVSWSRTPILTTLIFLRASSFQPHQE